MNASSSWYMVGIGKWNYYDVSLKNRARFRTLKSDSLFHPLCWWCSPCPWACRRSWWPSHSRPFLSCPSPRQTISLPRPPSTCIVSVFQSYVKPELMEFMWKSAYYFPGFALCAFFSLSVQWNEVWRTLGKAEGNLEFTNQLFQIIQVVQ